MWLHFHYFACAVYLFGASKQTSIDADEIRAENIDVKPTGEKISETKDLEGFTCTFTYEAEGGTDEEWHMKLAVDTTKTQFSCSVVRDRMSYLYFENFQMEVTGGKVTQGTVLGHEGKPLPPSEYSVDLNENKVYSNEDKFEHALNVVELVAERPREEL